jgi:hypothetical protein
VYGVSADNAKRNIDASKYLLQYGWSIFGRQVWILIEAEENAVRATGSNQVRYLQFRWDR